ncbi:alcohol dehydrogenase catalytic domain-containing protein [Ferrimonas aestuarii]|uniref:Alcohol dehydrogenase n=1 Tax=Ferrimonas aestuarii TaxID=2569539 RepID=A0A4U1BUB5_9GAMM|nr:zinc-binding dehydrogenase [Ferrimonas aestuarii]TKB57625.1 alcohol dehydrogenase [Ferrimonas aestuarii]
MGTQTSWQYQGAGQSLVMAPVAIPTPQAHQVLVANRVIGLNPVDWKLIQYGHGAWQPGHIPGVDGAGEVVAVGDGVDTSWLGQRVSYHADLTRHGSFAEYTLVDVKALMAIADGVTDARAAAFPCPGLTAWQAVAKFPSLKGKRILVCGGGSAVGRIAVQLLLAKGAKVSTTASKANHAMLLEWGVSQCVDYKAADWKPQLANSVEDGQFDGAIDLVSADNAAALFDLLNYGSHLVSVLGRVEPLGDAFAKCVSLHEIALGAIYQFGSDTKFAELTQAGERLLEKIGQQQLEQVPHKLMAFEELADALTQLQAGGKTQKYLIQVA